MIRTTAGAGVAAPSYRRGTAIGADYARAGGVCDVVDRTRKERAWAAAAGQFVKTVSRQPVGSDVEGQMADASESRRSSGLVYGVLVIAGAVLMKTAGSRGYKREAGSEI